MLVENAETWIVLITNSKSGGRWFGEWGKHSGCGGVAGWCGPFRVGGLLGRGNSGREIRYPYHNFLEKAGKNRIKGVSDVRFFVG